MDFEGVSGRINFKNRPSRLSNVRILQWLKNTSNHIFENDIGLYSPDYGELENNKQRETYKGKMEIWKDKLIRWQTLDGSKPLDNPKECGILSTLATKLDIDCQLAITLVFIIGFIILVIVIFIVFYVLRRRFDMDIHIQKEFTYITSGMKRKCKLQKTE